MFSSLLLCGAVLLSAGGAPRPAATTAVVSDCLIIPKAEAQVSAQEPGVLVELKVVEGSVVKKGEELAQIDDAKPQAETRVTRAKLEVARVEASNDVNIRYATASAQVARAEYDVNVLARETVKNAVSQTELNRLALKVREALLSIEKATMEKTISGHQVKVAEAEQELTEENIRRRKVRSPLDGIVVKINKHVGEWVQPGYDQHPVMHVVGLDHLWVEGTLDPDKFSPSEILSKAGEVEVTVTTARGQKKTVFGRVVFVKPVIDADGFVVRAEIKNERDGDHWALAPGMKAEMKIQLK